MMHAIIGTQHTKMGAGVGPAHPLMVITCLGGETVAHGSKPIQFCLECSGLGSRRGVACLYCNGTGAYIPISEIDEEALALADRIVADERRAALRLVRDQQIASMRLRHQERTTHREHVKQQQLTEKQERLVQRRIRAQARILMAAAAREARERAKQERAARTEARRRRSVALAHQRSIEKQRILQITQEVAQRQAIEKQRMRQAALEMGRWQDNEQSSEHELRIQAMVDLLEQEQQVRRRRQADSMYERYTQHRLWFSTLKSGIGCQCCGEVESVSLDFHHIDPQSKSFGLGLGKWSTSFDRIRAEMEKCLLLCSNCHRRVTAKTLDVSHLQVPDYDAAWKRVEHLRPLTDREQAEQETTRSGGDLCG